MLPKGERATLAYTKYVKVALDDGLLTSTDPARARREPAGFVVRLVTPEELRAGEPAVESNLSVSFTDNTPVVLSEEPAHRKRRRHSGGVTSDDQQRATEPTDVCEPGTDVPERLP